MGRPRTTSSTDSAPRQRHPDQHGSATHRVQRNRDALLPRRRCRRLHRCHRIDPDVRYSAPLRTRRPLYPTSSGKCFLAHAGDAFRENYLAAHIPDEDMREQVRAELRTIADDGVAINRGQTLPDVCGVSVPVFGNGQLLAVLAMAGPTTPHRRSTRRVCGRRQARRTPDIDTSGTLADTPRTGTTSYPLFFGDYRNPNALRKNELDECFPGLLDMVLVEVAEWAAPFTGISEN
ncbi:IclR family transcriptional regulator domain-containing protein [Gordonia aurantiaca]|uniref:IclR family transcriptional regulator domain-containing protein n=1 Tax=Gordonia sp. B21 TaxID=3151852 RepID=UPI0032639DCD